MNLTGFDLILETSADGFDPRSILEVVQDQWPDAVLQDADETAARPLPQVLANGTALQSTEFFLFEDQTQADSWNAHGRTDANANRMVHFIIAHDVPLPGNVQVTMVIDAFTAEMARLFSNLHALFSDKRGQRVNMDEALRSAGSVLTRSQFYDLVEGLRVKLHPYWSQDELACHPHDALQFCEIVRRQVNAPLPDNLIMKAMLNRRKHL